MTPAEPTVIALSMSTSGCLGLVRGGAVTSLGAFGVMPVLESLIVGAYETLGFELGSTVNYLLTYPRACTAGELTALVNNI